MSEGKDESNVDSYGECSEGNGESKGEGSEAMVCTVGGKVESNDVSSGGAGGSSSESGNTSMFYGQRGNGSEREVVSGTAAHLRHVCCHRCLSGLTLLCKSLD